MGFHDGRVLAGTTRTEHHRLPGFDNRKFFLLVLEAGGPRSRGWVIWCLVGASYLVCPNCILSVASHRVGVGAGGKRGREGERDEAGGEEGGEREGGGGGGWGEGGGGRESQPRPM